MRMDTDQQSLGWQFLFDIQQRTSSIVRRDLVHALINLTYIQRKRGKGPRNMCAWVRQSVCAGSGRAKSKSMESRFHRRRGHSKNCDGKDFRTSFHFCEGES